MKKLFVIVLALCVSPSALPQNENGVRLKELGRIEGVRENPLVGYGLVVGLSGTGDSQRNRATVQSVVNALANFGVLVEERDISSRNVAAVMVTATLPAFAEPGDKLDVQASSVGDAKSLMGGTLLMTPLHGPDDKLYALAQGSLATGGYYFESFESSVQKNHPTVGIVPDGATVERTVAAFESVSTDEIVVVLNQPDFTTAERIVQALAAMLPEATVSAAHAGKVAVRLPDPVSNPVSLIAQIENVLVAPDQRARVVVNERTGTVVAGGEVRIADVTVSHGNLQVVIDTYYQVSQPNTFLSRTDSSIRTVVVPDTEIEVIEQEGGDVTLPAGTTVADLVAALRRIHLNTRDVITVLQAIKSAGALHGELIIQ